MVTRWQSLLMDKQEGMSDVGCRMDGFLLGNLPRETLTARDAPWKHLGFFVEDEFLLKGKEDY